MGAHIPVDKGEWVVLLDNGCVVPYFVFLFKCMVGTFFLSGGRGGGGVGALTSRFYVCVGVCLFFSRQLFTKISTSIFHSGIIR